MGSLPWWMKIVVEEEQENRKGPWTLEEDNKLISYIRVHGAARWSSLAKLAGLKRDGKSCRMRWLNYLRPELKHGSFSPEEDQLIIELQKKWGNKWSCIAQNLPGRTDNEIKNHWRTHIMKMSPKFLSTSKSPQEIMDEGETNKASSSKDSEYSQMATWNESFNESDSDNAINKVSCDTCESDCGSHEELVEQSCYMDTVNNIIADAYAAGIVQHSTNSSWSCGADCAMNVLSDSQDFIWDYNSIDLWNLNDVESIYQ